MAPAETAAAEKKRGRQAKPAGAAKKLLTQQSVDAAIKQVCDILRRSNCAGALQYVPELTWMLFLRILDERETREAEEAEAVGQSYAHSLAAPYRWQDWAAPGGPTRVELTTVRPRGSFFDFINTDLLPYLKGLDVWSRSKVVWVSDKGTRIFSIFGTNELVGRKSVEPFESFGKVVSP